MHNTKAKLEAIVPFPLVDNWKPSATDKVHINLEFDLVYEDWELFKESRDFMNEHLGRDDDNGDHMLSLITWAIHQAYEQRTGKPFVLRMDRPKN